MELPVAMGGLDMYCSI